uniref:Putative heteroproteinous nuclear ribonucleoprotein r rrm superfamily n=1 Tax=Anopheles braziliensis TaxID=58242 RepID=A0A2M3ZLC6_9DIPT
MIHSFVRIFSIPFVVTATKSFFTAGLVEVIIYSSPDDKKKNRGFCFLEYESHKAASLAKRRLGTGRIKVWNCDIIVDWADPQEEPDEKTMSKVKVLYVRNLTQDTSEEKLKESFEQFGRVERVKKIKDYAFVHFEDRDNAVKAMKDLDGKEIGGSNIEVSLAKPPSDKKKKEEILRARERRMTQFLQTRIGLVSSVPSFPSMSPQHAGMMPGAMPPMRVPSGAGGPRGAPMRGGGPMGRGEYGGWSWTWNHGTWPNRWGPWQQQPPGGPTGSASGHRGGSGTNRGGGPWAGSNSSQRVWAPARQTKYTSNR